MKAITLNQFGTVNELKLSEISIPIPKNQKILVKVHAAGINPVDTKIREGSSFLCGTIKQRLPWIPGYDFSGVIEKIGSEVKGFQNGDAVLGKTALLDGGCYAEYLSVSPNQIVKKPNNLSFEQAAGVPSAALTAWQALFEQGQIQNNQTVLIHAAAGGVGHFAVQFAKQAGAKVIATASARHKAFLQTLNVDEWIDYTQTHFENVLNNIDCVIDNVGGETGIKSLKIIKESGTVVTVPTITADQVLQAAKAINKSAKKFVVEFKKHQLEEIVKLIEEDKIKVHIDSIFKLEQAKDAHEKIQEKHAQGKIVLRMI